QVSAETRITGHSSPRLLGRVEFSEVLVVPPEGCAGSWPEGAWAPCGLGRWTAPCFRCAAQLLHAVRGGGMGSRRSGSRAGATAGRRASVIRRLDRARATGLLELGQGPRRDEGHDDHLPGFADGGVRRGVPEGLGHAGRTASSLVVLWGRRPQE